MYNRKRNGIRRRFTRRLVRAATESSLPSLELEAPDDHALPRLKVEDAAKSGWGRRGYSTEAGRRVAVIGAARDRESLLLELEVAERRTAGVAPERAVEYVGELHPN